MAEKLGELLIENGMLTEAQVKTALRTQEFFGGHLGSILIDLGFVDEQTIGEMLSRSAGVRYAPPEALDDISDEALKVIPAKLAERHKVIPILIQDKRLHLVMLDPKNLTCVDEISALTEMVVIPYVALEFRIYHALERYYDVASDRTERISMAGKFRPDDLTSAETGASEPAPESEDSFDGVPGVGLDGLPLDADLPFEEDPFAPPAAPPDTETFLEHLPRSLNEWREDGQEPAKPSVQAPPPVAAPWTAPPASPAAPAQEAVWTRPVQAPAPAEDPLRETVSRLLTAESRDDIAEILLNATGTYFRRRLLFFFQRDRIVGWDGWGDQVSRERVRNVLLPMESLSLFTAVKSGSHPYRGPVADLPANRRLFEDLGIGAPPEVVLLPVVIKGRVVSVLYGDNGASGLGYVDMTVLRRISLQAAIALEILILRRKIISI